MRAGPPENGLEVIGWMRHAHPSRELKTLSYALRLTEYARDSQMVSRAQGFAELPGRFRMSLLPTTLRSGLVRDRQRLAVFEGGRRLSSASSVDLVALLAFDVFAEPIDITIMWLDSARMRFGLLRAGDFGGRRVWVVGAEEGDTLSTQFWVDAVEWRVLRIIQRDPLSPGELVDVRFSEYADLLDVPVPRRIDTYRGGKLAQRQEISELSANPVLPSRTFDLARWRDPREGL